MADQKRKLNIPMYETSTSEGIEPEGDAIDAEVIEDAPTLGDRMKARLKREAQAAADAARNSRTNGVKDTLFTKPKDARREARGQDDEGVRSRQEGRARRAGDEQLRKDQQADAKASQGARVKLGEDAKIDPLAKLKLDTLRAGEAYVLSLRKSGILAPGETKQTQRRQLSGMHQVYASMMVLQCVQPLQQGLNRQNVASVLGMGASMWLLSPNFRNQVGTFADQMGGVIREKINSRGLKKDHMAQEKLAELTGKGKGDLLADKWQRRLDNIEHAKRGHRLPFTAQSAAMTEIALAESAYADLRRPGADTAGVNDRYESALSALYDYVDADGLDREDVSRSMRVMVGQRLAKDPSVANVFSELGHGRFTKGPPREVYLEGGVESTTVWTGDFVDSYENRTVSSGSFKMRPPVGVDQHRALISETLSAEMVSATSVGELNDVLSQYVVASSVGRYPDVSDLLEDPNTRRRFGKAGTMFNSMSADGLSAEDQQFAYSAAYVDAVEVVQRLNPELGNKWIAEHGDQWRDKVAESMKAYNDLGAEAERAKAARSGKAGKSGQRGRPAGDPRPGQRFRASADGDVRDEDPFGYASSGEDIVDADVVDDFSADEDLVDHARSQSSKADYEQSVELHSTASRVRRARVNQHYNDVETGGVTGIGSDDAEPLQDVDFQLG
jgi:hypothetical protein